MSAYSPMPIEKNSIRFARSSSRTRRTASGQSSLSVGAPSDSRNIQGLRWLTLFCS